MKHFGDYQTPISLVEKVYNILDSKGISFKHILEPTVGQGNFLIEGINRNPSLNSVVGIEIQEYYVNILKKRIEDEKLKDTLEVSIINDSFFNCNLKSLLKPETLIIGNPPWVTNSELGTIGSDNLPLKINFKNHKGLDALTGKSNFDIAEYILLSLLTSIDTYLTKSEGNIAFLVKKIVATNILKNPKKSEWNITTFDIYNFDAKKEFNVSADACLVLIRTNEIGKKRVDTAQEFNIDSPHMKVNEFGWVKDKFVANVDAYVNSSVIDSDNTNESLFVWRSGIKHDASSIMELDYDKYSDRAISKTGDSFSISENNIYPLYKSSHIRKITKDFYPTKSVIVTQKKVSEKTDDLKYTSPHVWEYLNKNAKKLDERKSSIYKGKPRFSIFGVGSYSFQKYKLAISGMYKESKFALIPPFKDKTVMVDDTVYFISTDLEYEAYILFGILNNALIQDFLNSISFLGNKRPYTKDILQRISLSKAIQYISLNQINDLIREYGYSYKVTEEEFKIFYNKICSLTLF